MKTFNLSFQFIVVIVGVLILTTISSAQQNVNILIVYYSVSGTTQQMANGVKEGVESDSNTIAVLKTVDDVTDSDLNSADGIILGSPTYWGNIASPMKEFLDRTGFWEGKVGGAFSTGAMKTGGKEHVIFSLITALLMKGVIIAGPVYRLTPTIYSGAIGASAMTGPPDDGVSESELNDARALGKRIGLIALQLKSGVPSGIANNTNQLPRKYDLEQNFPNPFNPTTKINYELPQSSKVVIKIFDALGKEVRLLVNKDLSAGKYQVEWNGMDNNFRSVATGVYFYQLNVNGTSQTKKMLLLK